MVAISCSDVPCRKRDVAKECRSKCAAPRLGRLTSARRNALSTISETAADVRKAHDGARERMNNVSAFVRGRPFFR
jgi:hypothetical protein